MNALPKLTVTRTTVTEGITARLRDAVVAGELDAGERLAEAKLAEAFGTSRAPVREALAALGREGLVRFDRRGTAAVADLTGDDVRELLLMRTLIEPTAARLAAGRVRADDPTLAETIAATRRAKSLAEVSRLDVEFHRLLVRAAGQSRLLAAWEALAGQFLLCMSRHHRTIERTNHKARELTADTHAGLVRVLAAGDPAAAEAAVRSHAEGWLRNWSAEADTPAPG